MSAADIEVGKADFDFYAKFAKPLILTLNCTEDRILASAWFSKLRDETSGPDKLRLDYLKLLLFVLQRHRLAGPFVENPNIQEGLEEFDENYDLATLARQIIEKEQQEKREKCLKRIRGEIGDFPPFSTDYSPDLKEYVAAQDIPNFGVHVYYAISRDPILDWENAQHAVFPRAVRRMEPQGHFSETSFAVMEPRPETPDETEKCKIMEETGVMPDESIFLGRKARQRKSPFIDIDRPAPPLGVLPGEGEADIIDEGLAPPTWGSNLIEVREPLEVEGPETPPPEEAAPAAGPPTEFMEDVGAPAEEPDDPEIVKLLETSFNMEDILAEVDAMEIEDEKPPEGFEAEVDPMILAEQEKFREMEDALDRHDAAIAEAMADLDEDEKRMLLEMEAEEEAAKAPKPKAAPKKEVKVLADDDTVIKVLLEAPEAAVESREEKKRKDAKAEADKKKRPAGRTGLNKGKAKGAILKPGEKKALEKEDKKAKVVATKTGVPSGPSKRPGVPKVKATVSKGKVAATASTGKIPSQKPSASKIAPPGKGIPRPAGTGIPKPGGTGIPRPGGTGIPRPGGTGIPKPGARGIPRPAGARSSTEMVGASEELKAAYEERRHMESMMSRLNKMLDETKQAFPESFVGEEEQAGPAAGQMQVEEEAPRRLSPIQEISMQGPMATGSPESDDIYDEMEQEYKILERLYELYQKLAPDQPEEMRTPAPFSKHPQIRELGRQLRYRADEFDINPMERFVPAEQYFAGEGGVPPSDFFDPRDIGRRGVKGVVPEDVRARGPGAEPPMRMVPRTPMAAPPIAVTGPSPPQPEAPPAVEESPPWGGIEELKKIAERAERRVEASPAITAGVGVTTPKSPATPKRPARRDLKSEFDVESPPPYESPPGSPEPMGTPEFLRIQSYGIPKVLTEEDLNQMYADKYPEYEAYMQAEIEAEREKWGRFAPRPPGAAPPPMPATVEGMPGPITTPGPSSYVTPPKRGARFPYPGTPPSVGRRPGTPEELPAKYRFHFMTPPFLKRDDYPDIGSPVFAEFNPLEHEDVVYQTAPDLVEAEFDEFEQAKGSPQFELKEWYDPLKKVAEGEPFEMGLDMPLSPELVPFEDEPAPPSPPYSPLMDLQMRLMQHEIEPEFRDPARPDLPQRLQVGMKAIKLKRKSKPSRLARKTIEEDLSGELFEEEENRIEEEEERFLDRMVSDEGRAEHMKKMIEEAQTKGEQGLEAEEEPPELIEFDEEDLDLGPEGEPRIPTPPPSPFRSPIRTPERPVKPVATPPPAPGRGQLLWEGTPERVDRGMFMEEEADFLASPGLPSPPQPSPPPPMGPTYATPPRAPPRQVLMYESPPPAGAEQFFDEEAMEGFLASPGMPSPRTQEEEFQEIGTPVKLPPAFWEQPPPAAPAPAPAAPPRVPSPPRMAPQPQFMPPPGSPEFDPAALQRELRGHKMEYPKARSGGFRAGTRWVGRRSARNVLMVPIGEHVDYESSKKIPTQFRDYRQLMTKLPPAPPPAPYPGELMGEPHAGRFHYPDYLMDQPIPVERGRELPPPLDPEWQLHGWQTPPHLRTRPLEEIVRSPQGAVVPYTRASHYRDPLLFEEAPEGVFVPMEEEVIPGELMGEEFTTTPPRRVQPSRLRPLGSPQTPTLPPRPPGIMPREGAPAPPPMSIPTMTMGQQMNEAAQMAQWQAQQISSPRAPSPPRATMPAPAPHWSPEAGPSWMPHQYPYAPPRQPSPPQPSPPRPSPPRRISPDRLKVPTPGSPPCAPEPGPKITKRVKEISYTSEFYDPDSPERSTKFTKGRTMLEFNRPQGDQQRPVQTPPPQGVAVYARGPPISADEYGPQMPMPMPQMAQGMMPQQVPQRARAERRGDTPQRQGGLLPRRRILGQEGDKPRRNLLRQFSGEEMTEPEPLPRVPQPRGRAAPVCPGPSSQNERIQVVEEYEETEHDFIPEHLRGFRWIDEPIGPGEDEFYDSFRQQFQQ